MLSVAFLCTLCVKFRKAQPKTSEPCVHFDFKIGQLISDMPVFEKVIYRGSGKETGALDLDEYGGQTDFPGAYGAVERVHDGWIEFRACQR
jgi:hypothetical protein